MIGTVRPTLASSPHCGSENDHRQEKEHAGNLKPQNSTDAAKGTQKAADAAGDAPRSLACDLAGSARLGRGRRGGSSSLLWGTLGPGG